MVRCIVCIGIPASGKSTWAKEEVRKSHGKCKRVNRDDLRAMIDAGEYSPSNEKLVVKIRDSIIQHSVKNGIDVICDDTNIKDKGKNFNDICALVKQLNVNVLVMEKHFYIDLDDALARDAARPASVGEKVLRGFWDASGQKGFAHYHPRVEMFHAVKGQDEKKVVIDPNLKGAIICDLDGTLSLLNGRNPYDASNCDENDVINIPVAETVKLYHNAGYSILFCSGRKDEYKPQTIRFIEKHLPNVKYNLFMRKSDDNRKDSIVKSEMFKENIEGKYNVLLVLDDRDSVVQLWREELGLTAFQVAPGNF